MKFALIAAVVLLALAQGSFAQDAADLAKLGQYFEELRTKVTEELSQMMNNKDLTGQARTLLEDGKTQLEPLATQLQDQIKTVATNVEEQIRPLAANVQAHMQPVLDNFQRQIEAIFQKITEAKAIGN